MSDRLTTKIAKISSKGQIAIPIALRRQLSLQDGDQVTISLTADNELILKKLPTALDWHNLVANIPNEKVSVDPKGHYDPKKAPYFHEWMNEG